MTFRRHIGFIPAAASLIFAACTASVPDPAPSKLKKPDVSKPAPEKTRAVVSSISLEDFFQIHESGKALVIDARPSFVYQFGHVPGAINMPKKRCGEEIPQREAEFRKAIAAGRKIVVYCTGTNCPDAGIVAGNLATSGIPASVFHDGWEAWHEAGMPVE